MRIQGTNAAVTTGAPSGARRAAAGGFSLSDSESSRQSGPAGTLRSISSLDALMALQGVEDSTARRKRAVVRGRHALDALESLKVALLDGTLDRPALARLKVAADGLTEQTGDAGLDEVMREIDLRVAVELAKAGMA